MFELPEACILAKQVVQSLTGKKIALATANSSPHKFAWFHGDPADYDKLLRGKRITGSTSYGGLLQIEAGDTGMVFGDGVSLKFLEAGAKHPMKHQLLLEFTDGSALTASVQMYGGLWAFPEGEFTNPYYLTARAKPSPLTDGFNEAYFASLLDDTTRKKSAKAFLATEQRVPGLGNGVLQDILFNARIHPRRSMDSLTDEELSAMFRSVKSTLKQMAEQGGRDTEKDLFGQPGGYVTRLSKNTLHYPCPVCGGELKKEAYMGGSIYYCSVCQLR